MPLFPAGPASAPLRLSKSGALEATLLGGAAIALLDAANATAFWHFYRGTPPQVIFQSIAAGLLGKQAFAGGAATAALGVGLHGFFALAIAGVYCLACRRWPTLLGKPSVYGAIYGVIVYVVMNQIVARLSLQPQGPFRLAWFLDNFFGHLILVGPPVALIAGKMTSRLDTL